MKTFAGERGFEPPPPWSRTDAWLRGNGLTRHLVETTGAVQDCGWMTGKPELEVQRESVPRNAFVLTCLHIPNNPGFAPARFGT